MKLSKTESKDGPGASGFFTVSKLAGKSQQSKRFFSTKKLAKPPQPTAEFVLYFILSEKDDKDLITLRNCPGQELV